MQVAASVPGCQPRQPFLALLGLMLAAPQLLSLPCGLLLRLPFLLSSRCQLLQLPLHQCPVMRIAKPQALQFASIQLQELRPIHLPGSKLSGILFQVEAVQPLTHLLAGPVFYSREGLIQKLI